MGGSSCGESSSSGEVVGASKAASLVFRIATMGLSLASAIMTAASTQCVYGDNGAPAGTVSYTDYHAFKYSALADLLSAALQGVAIWLEATGKERWAKTVELIDKVVQALTSTSSALLFAVDDITSCGPPRRGSLCDRPGAFCRRVRWSSALSLAATVSVSVSIYTRHVPVAATPASSPPVPIPVPAPVPAPKPAPPEPEPPEPKPAPEPKPKPEPPEPGKKKDKDGVENKQCPCTQDSTCTCTPPPTMPPPWCRCPCTQDSTCICTCTPPPTMPPPPWCRCPRLTIPCDCQDPDLCGAFF